MFRLKCCKYIKILSKRYEIDHFLDAHLKLKANVKYYKYRGSDGKSLEKPVFKPLVRQDFAFEAHKTIGLVRSFANYFVEEKTIDTL